MVKPAAPDTALDRALEDLPAAYRWRAWMRRIEAVLFASATPVPREVLARVVGQGAAVDLLIADLTDRPYEIAKTAEGWLLRTRPPYAAVIRAAAEVGGQALDLNAFDTTVLAAIAYHQPITRDGLKDIFGKEMR
jgi:chromosome segregation and condensation protein ScpB